MADKDARIALCVIAGAAVIVIVYYAMQQTGDQYVPEVQTETQVMGLGVQASMRTNPGTPLDTSYEIHGWFPGYDPVPIPQPVVDSPHRYPSVPGGNISTVLHNGWSQACKAAPAGNDWRIAPPEAAVL